MANLIQATVYQIDGSPLPSSAIVDFQTSNLVIREAAINIAEVNSAILYYNVPNNTLSVQTFYVGETISELVSAANVGTTTQVQATVLEINEDPQVPGGVQYSFPANEILVGESVNAVTGVNSYIQFKNVKYFASELQADLLVSGNGASAYKVYTALLTQSGGDDPQGISSGAVTKGVTYMIDGTSSDADFSNVGGPKYDGVTTINGTYFVAINNDVPNNYSEGQLLYNTGAPVVTVLENTIGNIWFTYSSVGIYLVNSSGLFTANKTFFSEPAIDISLLSNIEKFLFIGWNNENTLTLNNTDGSLISTDDMGRGYLEIRVYN